MHQHNQNSDIIKTDLGDDMQNLSSLALYQLMTDYETSIQHHDAMQLKRID